MSAQTEGMLYLLGTGDVRIPLSNVVAILSWHNKDPR